MLGESRSVLGGAVRCLGEPFGAWGAVRRFGASDQKNLNSKPKNSYIAL